MPARSAAAMIISSGLAWTALPSTVMVIVSGSASDFWSVPSAKGAAAFLDVDQELVAKHLDGRGDRRWDRRPQHADRRLLGRPGEFGSEVVAHVEQQVEVALPAPAQLDTAHDLVQPATALAAGRALAARLAVEEPGDAPRSPDHAGGVVHDDHRPRAEHRARLADLLLAQRHVELVGAEPRGRRPARDEGFELVVVADAATEVGVVDEVAEGRLDHLDLEVGGPLHVTGEREEAGTSRATVAQGGVGLTAVEDDPGQVRQRLHIVDDRRQLVEA